MDKDLMRQELCKQEIKLSKDDPFKREKNRRLRARSSLETRQQRQTEIGPKHLHS